MVIGKHDRHVSYEDGTGFTARASHTEVVDPYRAGVAGTADCT